MVPQLPPQLHLQYQTRVVEIIVGSVIRLLIGQLLLVTSRLFSIFNKLSKNIINVNLKVTRQCHQGSRNIKLSKADVFIRLTSALYPLKLQFITCVTKAFKPKQLSFGEKKINLYFVQKVTLRDKFAHRGDRSGNPCYKPRHS